MVSKTKAIVAASSALLYSFCHLSAAVGEPKAPATTANPPSKPRSLDLSHPYGYHLEPILQKIKATDDQRKKITELVESFRGKIDPLRQDYKKKQSDFLESLTSSSSSETIMQKQMELSHLYSEITARYTVLRLAIRRMLNSEQIVLYEEYCRVQGWTSASAGK